MDQLHILLGALGQVLCKLFQSLLRVMSQEYRIREPGHIPGPVIHRIIEAEVHPSGRLNIFRGIGIRISNSACRSISYLDRLFRILSEFNHCLSVGLQQIVSDLKGLLVGKL